MTKTTKLWQTKTQQEQTKDLAKTKRGLQKKKEKSDPRRAEERRNSAVKHEKEGRSVTEKGREKKNARDRRKNERRENDEKAEKRRAKPGSREHTPRPPNKRGRQEQPQAQQTKGQADHLHRRANPQQETQSEETERPTGLGFDELR